MPPFLRIALPVLLVLLLAAATWWMLTGEDASAPSPDPTPLETEPTPLGEESEIDTLETPDPGPQPEATPQPVEPPAQQLLVVDWLGAPIEDARVVQDGEVLGRTKAEGRVALPADWQDRGSLEVTAGGYLPYHGTPDPEERTVRLARAGAIFGELVTAEGQPVEQFTLTARRQGPGGEPVARGDRFRNGRFELTGLEPLPHRLRFESQRHPVLKLDGIRPSEEPLRLRLPAGGRIEGRVVSTAEEPLPGLWVYALPASPRPGAGDERPGQSPSMQTGADGAFQFPRLLPGDYRLVLGSIAEPIEEAGPIMVSPGQTTEHEFRLMASGRLELTFVDERGTPLPGVDVRLYHRRFGYQRVGATDEEGRFEAGDLLIGTYRVSASLKGFQRFAQSFTIPGGTPQIQTVTMERE